MAMLLKILVVIFYTNIEMTYNLHTFYQYYFVDLTDMVDEERRYHQSNYKLYYSQSILVDG